MYPFPEHLKSRPVRRAISRWQLRHHPEEFNVDAEAGIVTVPVELEESICKLLVRYWPRNPELKYTSK